MAEKKTAQLPTMNQRLFDNIGKAPFRHIKGKVNEAGLIAAQQVGDEENVYCIFDYVGVRKVKPEDYQSIKSQIAQEYLKESKEYPRLLFVNGSVEKTGQGYRIKVKTKYKLLNKV